MNCKKIILDNLLNKYEKSKSYLSLDNNRRIILKMRDVKEYDIESYEIKKMFHDTIKGLSQKDLIYFSWKQWEIENILEEVWLNKEKVEYAYKEINRTNIKLMIPELIVLLEQNNFESEWIENYRIDMINTLKLSQKVNSLFPYEYCKDIIKVLHLIDKKEEYLKRIFSIKCFNDSKYFENYIENILIRIIKQYLLKKEYEEDYTIEEILLEVGIFKSPEIMEFSGDMSCHINNQHICYKRQTSGSYINSCAIKMLESMEIIEVRKIIFIENKTDYINYILNNQKESEFVVYHGGMYSPSKLKFFQKIYDCTKNSNIEYYHWSDIDIGGFNIFTRLKNNVIPQLKPYLMDKQAFLLKKDYWQQFDKQYRKKLENMVKNEKYEMFHDVIEEMLQYDSKLEQESFIV